MNTYPQAEAVLNAVAVFRMDSVSMDLPELEWHCRKTSIEITRQDWKTYETDNLSFLGIERRPDTAALPPDGIYKNESLGFSMEISGLSLKDPNGTRRTLTPKSDQEFYVECLPVILSFQGRDRITLSGGQLSEWWITAGTEFVRG